MKKRLEAFYKCVGSVCAYGCQGWTMTQAMALQIKSLNWQKLRVLFRLKPAPWDEGHSGYCIRTAS
eukprot:8979100-Lingulodinium_polyedra.AAC.1